MDYSFLIGVHRYGFEQQCAPDSLKEGMSPGTAEKNSETIGDNAIAPVSIFRKDNGGLCSSEKDEVYFLSIIDIFTNWTVKKRMENSLKSLMYEATGISAIPPAEYRTRFLKFLAEIIQ